MQVQFIETDIGNLFIFQKGDKPENNRYGFFVQTESGLIMARETEEHEWRKATNTWGKGKVYEMNLKQSPFPAKAFLNPFSSALGAVGL